MRRTNLLGGMHLLGALSFSLLAQAQQPEDKIRLQSTDVAVTYSAEGGKVAPSKSDRFWMHGGSAEAAFTFYRGLGLAVNINGQHASSIAPGVDVNKVSFVVGPRYSYDTTRFTERWLKSRKTSVFGETLMGATHAFNGLFPSGMQGIKSGTNAFAAQIGGGVNVSLAKGFGLRPFQMDYIYTALPNTGTDAQHDIRLSIGVTYHIGK
ncbi:MAG TPA: hypothetical protein VHR86_05445 [Armatimonadota bacterium]|nr:hypothetical protein [Armatimonadota bacterium]